MNSWKGSAIPNISFDELNSQKYTQTDSQTTTLCYVGTPSLLRAKNNKEEAEKQKREKRETLQGGQRSGQGDSEKHKRVNGEIYGKLVCPF